MPGPEWKKTACNICYVNCGVEVLVDDGKIAKVRGDRDNPKSQGYLCNKAARIPWYAHHRDRLTTPLRRRADGGFDEIDWDTAIAEIAARVRDLVERHGGKSLALYGGGGQGNHAGGAYATGFLRALGSRHVFNALSQEKTGDFWVNGHMFGSQTCHTAEDVHHCDLLFVIGANPWIAHGFPNARDHLNQIRKDPARKMIVIDPRRSETAEMADLHLAVRPGADAFLLGAILATLVRRDALDHEFLAQHTTGFDEVKAALLRIPVARMGRGRRHPARADRALRRHDRGRQGDDGAGRARHPAGRQLDAELLSRKAADHADRQFWPQRHQPAALLAAAAVGQLAEPAIRRDRHRSDRGPAAAERVSAGRVERSSGSLARGVDRQLQSGQHRGEHGGGREGARRARAVRRGRRRHDRDGAAGALRAAGLLAI